MKAQFKIPAILRSKWLMPGLESLALVALLGLIYLGVTEIPWLKRYSYLLIYAIWFLWWPLLILLVPLSIRLWCMVCPLRKISEIFGLISLRWKVPLQTEQMRLGFLALLFLTINTLTTQLNVGQFSVTTAINLLILLQYTAVLSWLFGPQSFCRVFCPVGALMEVFSRLGVLRLAPGERKTCQSCLEGCTTSCPSRLKVGQLPSHDCLLCGKCVRSCQEQEFVLQLQKPLQGRWYRGKWGESLLVVVLFGAMLSELMERVVGMTASSPIISVLLDKVFGTVPNQIAQLPGTFTQKGLLLLWGSLLMPLILMLGTTVLSRLVFFRRSFAECWRNLLASMIPVIYGGFLAVLVNYPLTLLHVPAPLRRGVMVVSLLAGLLTGAYLFIRQSVFAGERVGPSPEGGSEHC